MNDNLYKAMNENDMIHRMREAAERGDAEAAMKLGEFGEARADGM